MANNISWRRTVSVLFFAVLFDGGCGDSKPRVPRPVAGDSVTPTILDAGPWTSGSIARFAIQVEARGPDGLNVALLDNEDVPEDILPQVTVTFFRGDQLLTLAKEPTLERFC